MTIPVNDPVYGEREIELLTECVHSGWMSGEGPFVKEFEERFAQFVGVAQGVAVSNGTTAIEAGLAALHLPEGSEVIMPAFTIISCALAVIRNRLTPVLVDAEPDTWNMDPLQVEAKIGPRTRAIMVVHTYGYPAHMDPILDLAAKHHLIVFEDAAEVHGATYKGRMCGSMGRLAAFSFYANKIINTGEGGMIVTDDPFLAEQTRSLRNLCFGPQQRFSHHQMGYNFRMSNLQAAVGVAQMERVTENLDRKRRQGQLYRDGLGQVEGVRLQKMNPWANPVYWVNGMVLEEQIPLNAFEFAVRLKSCGVQTRPFFWPMHEQPVFKQMGLFKGEHYPVAESLARRGIYLPSGMGLSRSQIETVCGAVAELLAKDAL